MKEINTPKPVRFWFSAGRTAVSLGDWVFSHQNEDSGGKRSDSWNTHNIALFAAC